MESALRSSAKWASGLLLIGMLAACSQSAQKLSALQTNNETVCTLDGMVLNDFPGPKAQILYAEGEPDIFCDLMELFEMLAAPEEMRKVTAIFVQDMGKADWEQPRDNWIDAKAAVYVADSKKKGSMGPTFGSFASLPDAQAFVEKEGGKIVQFEQMTAHIKNKAGARTASHSTH